MYAMTSSAQYRVVERTSMQRIVPFKKQKSLKYAVKGDAYKRDWSTCVAHIYSNLNGFSMK